MEGSEFTPTAPAIEGGDPFAQGAPEIDPSDDPFKGTDFGDFDGAENGGTSLTEAAQQQAAAPLPVVDREGVVQEAPAAETPAPPAAAPAPEQPVEAPPAAAPAPAAPAAPAPQPVTQEAPSAPAEPAPAPELRETVEAAQEDAADAKAAEQRHEQEVAADVQREQQAEDRAAEAEASPDGLSGSAPPQNAVAESTEAPEPEEVKNAKSGRVTHRRYRIFTVEGSGTYKELTWWEKDGETVKAGTRGAKRQKIALARDTEHALKIGFAILGAPDAGAHLVAVAASSFQPRKVAPLPPTPERQRLKIT